jgi:hypothetical protein
MEDMGSFYHSRYVIARRVLVLPDEAIPNYEETAHRTGVRRKYRQRTRALRSDMIHLAGVQVKKLEGRKILSNLPTCKPENL